MRIDLDHNATTQPLPEVIDAVARHLCDSYANPGSRHAEGRIARRALGDARERIAAILGADPDEVIFTSGGTESINTAIFGLMSGPRRTILLTAGEHPATLAACRELKHTGGRLIELPVDQEGLLRVDALDSLPWGDIGLATLILAHNETGVIQDVVPLAERCRSHNVPLHLDGVQAAGKIPVDFHALNASALSIGAHKFHGPRGVGVLLLRKGATLTPRQWGGHQEQDRRAGTEPVALAVGMAVALEAWQRHREERTRHVSVLRDRLEAALVASCSPTRVNGSRSRRLPNTLNISFVGIDGEALLVNLDLTGIACSLGGTCASGSMEPAPALIAMGCPPEVYRSAVRLSLGCDNTPEEIDEAARRISDCVARLRANEPSM